MELNELLEALMSKATEKEDIELVAALKNKVEEKSKKDEADLQDALGQITHYKDLYKKSVLQGGFTNEPKVDAITPEAPKSFEELLSQFAEKE